MSPLAKCQWTRGGCPRSNHHAKLGRVFSTVLPLPPLWPWGRKTRRVRQQDRSFKLVAEKGLTHLDIVETRLGYPASKAFLCGECDEEEGLICEVCELG